MFYGIEIRAPFLNSKFERRPSSYANLREHLMNGLGKWQLRRLLAGNEIAKISYQKKLGFTPPFKKWIEKDLNDRITKSFENPHRELKKIVDFKAAAHLISFSKLRNLSDAKAVLTVFFVNEWLKANDDNIL